MMTFAKPLALVAILSLAPMNAMGADESSPPMKFLQTWAAAWRESDVDKMMGFYDSGKDTVAIESLGRIRKGPEQIRDMYETAFEELIFDRVTLTPIAKGQRDAAAWGTCRYKAGIRLKSDNTRYVLEVRGTFVLKKEQDAWKITLEHFSPIPDIPRVRRAGK